MPAQALVAAVPAETVDAWIAAAPPLEPRRLMPALMRLEGAPQPHASRAVALRYVQFCVERLGSTDPTVHNLAVQCPCLPVRSKLLLHLPAPMRHQASAERACTALTAGSHMLSQVSLHAQGGDERELLEFLQAARDPLGRPLYDAHFALRVARQQGHLHACVKLLCELNLHEVMPPGRIADPCMQETFSRRTAVSAGGSSRWPVAVCSCRQVSIGHSLTGNPVWCLHRMLWRSR